MKHFIVITFLLSARLLFAGSTISDHLTEIDGMEKSIESAEEEIVELKKKAAEEKNLERKQLIKKDIDNMEKSIKMFKELEQKVTTHVMLEHTRRERQEFKKNMENRGRAKQRGVKIGGHKKKWP